MSKAVVVTGGRAFDGAQCVNATLDRIDPDLVIQGGQTGADALARAWCDRRRALGKTCETFDADWDAFGRSAGPRRNAEMARRLVDLRQEGWEVLVVAFPGDVGTGRMIEVARRYGIPVQTVDDGRGG